MIKAHDRRTGAAGYVYTNGSIFASRTKPAAQRKRDRVRRAFQRDGNYDMSFRVVKVG